jgi:hypothetical protein
VTPVSREREVSGSYSALKAATKRFGMSSLSGASAKRIPYWSTGSPMVSSIRAQRGSAPMRCRSTWNSGARRTHSPACSWRRPNDVQPGIRILSLAKIRADYVSQQYISGLEGGTVRLALNTAEASARRGEIALTRRGLPRCPRGKNPRARAARSQVPT